MVQLKLRLSVEAILADVNLSETDNTNFSQNSFKYDELRSLNPEEIKNYFSNRWSDLALWPCSCAANGCSKRYHTIFAKWG